MTTGKRERRNYSNELKEEAIRLMSEMRGKDVSEKLGIGQSLLSRWKRAAEEEGGDAFRGHGNRAALEQENYELKKKLKQAELERDILKKATAYFAKNQV